MIEDLVVTSLVLGFTLGLAHAFDPDHLVAVGTLVTESENVRDSSLLGLWWGVGHTLSLMIVGGVVLSFKWVIPDRLATGLEIIVAGMIIVLGANVIWRAFHSYTVHWHPHQHEGTMHVHLHVHEAGSPEPHHHAHMSKCKALVVGMVHGLAGSAALSLAIMTTMSTISLGMLYIFLFGLGAIGGMLLMSMLISVPFLLSGQRLGRWSTNLRLGAGCFAIGFGGYLAWSHIG
ncbi:MAG: urease accessory protein [Nitrospirales bacterium]|nr:urease accessory protein [Nitrospirales bacterium]